MTQLGARLDVLIGPAGLEPAAPVLEPPPSNAGVARFVDFQGFSFWPTTPALLDNAGVDTNPGTVLRGGGHNTSSLSKFIGPPRHSCNRGVVRRLRQRR